MGGYSLVNAEMILLRKATEVGHSLSLIKWSGSSDSESRNHSKIFPKK